MTIYLLRILNVTTPAGTREPQKHLRFARQFDLPFVPPTPFHIEPNEGGSILITDLRFQEANNRFVCYQGWTTINNTEEQSTIESLTATGWKQE